MRFECLNGTFSKVAAMNVRRYKLVGSFPILGDGADLFCPGFVVKHLVTHSVTACLETGHKARVGWDAESVVAGLEGFGEDGIGIAVIGKHDVLIAAARTDREATHVICEEFADGVRPDVHFLRRGEGRVGRGTGGRALGLVERRPCRT